MTIVGVPTEVKKDEYRVGLRPVGAEMLINNGHAVLMQAGAGLGSGYEDSLYEAIGAKIVPTAEEAWGASDMIVKVKEPQPQEVALIRDGQTVFTYFHFAADRELTLGCLERGCISVAYETLTDDHGHLPLLTPMSEIAGKLSVQEGAKYLERPQGGRGILLGGVPGVEVGKVLVLGGGVVGTCAATVATGMGADVVMMDISIDRMRRLDEFMPSNCKTIYSDPEAIRDHLAWADLVVGAVLIPGAKAPNLVSHEDLTHMKPGSVIVDVAIDQGGCVETAKVTTHSEPIYTVDGVVHYCVGNMPGAVARTSTQALTNATMPWVLKLASSSAIKLAKHDHHFANAINTHRGTLTNQPVAEAHDLPFEAIAT
ncbi:MAG: alanine dehydrogenase [Phycisphaerae bacterium]|nr:alanine dehydrogenase [Phycisphaerae bacterium]|tara:strand:- start:307 stop:1416 length:1110 start_codon:yes stop_codon:yes gene_type:complete